MHSSLVEFASDVWEAACIIGKLVRTGREHDWKAPHQWVTEHRFSGNKRVVIFRLEVLFPSCSYSMLSNWEIHLKLKTESKGGSKMHVIRENVPFTCLIAFPTVSHALVIFMCVLYSFIILNILFGFYI